VASTIPFDDELLRSGYPGINLVDNTPWQMSSQKISLKKLSTVVHYSIFFFCGKCQAYSFSAFSPFGSMKNLSVLLPPKVKLFGHQTF